MEFLSRSQIEQRLDNKDDSVKDARMERKKDKQLFRGAHDALPELAVASKECAAKCLGMPASLPSSRRTPRNVIGCHLHHIIVGLCPTAPASPPTTVLPSFSCAI
jgi:hypothetical protein